MAESKREDISAEFPEGEDELNTAHLLQKMKYKEVLMIVKEEKIDIKGNRGNIMKVLEKQVSPEKIRAYYRQFRGAAQDLGSHHLVPLHEVMKSDEVEELLKKYECTINDIPKIKDTDPMVLKIGAKAGDVLKITRRSDTAGEAKYYRAVVRHV